MKILITIAFLVVTLGVIFFGNKLVASVTSQISRKRTSELKTSFFSIIILFLFFIQYCLLTQTSFPILIILLLTGATLTANLMHAIIGAIVGFSIKRVRHKINVMYVATSFEQSLKQPARVWVMVFASIFLYGSWIGALWFFWNNPLGSSNVHLWGAIFIFITPQITNIINTLNLITPIITSEYVDDDLRNASLSADFSNIIYSTIYFVFPFFMLHKEFSEKLTWLPPFWGLVLTPLILFIFFGIIPFFIGVYKFKNQRKYFLEWQRNWLQEFKDLLEFRHEEKKIEKILELENEIASQISEKKIYDFFKKIKNNSLDVPSNVEEQVFKILKDNSEDIKKWDLQLSFITKLEETKENFENKKYIEDLKKYIDTKLTEIKIEMSELSNKKNKLAGILTSLIIGIIVGLLKTYQSDLIQFLEKFKPH